MAASGKRRLLLNAFFNAQFNYCPCGCSTAVAITRRSNTYVKDISDLSAMIKAESAFIDHNNILELDIEMFKVKTALVPEIVKDTFIESNENNYNYRTKN